ncbi:ABC transporter ATP-binding protein [Erythrobacter litoralis]|uniref:Ferrichrome ABC transporter ATP-binding protein n=1 Tax=Erythrobacter litoralis (strain HTCC2594) TaxID=314225 RepID=Q2N9G0_ERYLH|nr:ABC transporter ATP-binding protein [Erythrobacter litoralis]ABC63681.1 Ferrichrome ABC transporter ATP-binding protein [Erythrobacter litoralis HTCC2594]
MNLSAQNLAVGTRLVDVSLTLEPGTVTAICGPNGAGKTTLLTALAGLQDDASGNVMLDGEPLSSLHPRERARAIGYLPQDGEIAWDVAVRNLVRLGRLPHRDRGEDAVDRALAALDLVAFADRPVSTLSGGEKARALLARVLAGEPRWILADEPLAALDLAHQFTLISHLRLAAESGTGVVLVLHDLAMARNHADRVLVLDRGRMVADAPPAEALSPDTIAAVFSVNGEWIGPLGQMAFSCYPTEARTE